MSAARAVEVASSSRALPSPSAGESVNYSASAPSLEDGEEDKPRRVPTKRIASVLATFGNFMKSFIGSGILAMPFAFKQSGLAVFWLGIVTFLACILLAGYCIDMLIACKTGYGDNPMVQDFASIGFQAFGRWGSNFVDGMLIFTQLGFCCAYIIYAGKSLNGLVPSVNHYIFMAATLPLLIPLSWVRNLGKLGFTSYVGNVLLSFGLLCIMIFSFKHLQENGAGPDVKAVSSSFPVSVGAFMFSVEGIGMILPMESTMKHRKKFHSVLFAGLTIYSALVILFGVSGYISFGSKISSNIFDDIQHNGISVAADISITIMLLLTYPLMIAPVIELSERRIFQSYAIKLSTSKKGDSPRDDESRRDDPLDDSSSSSDSDSDEETGKPSSQRMRNRPDGRNERKGLLKVSSKSKPFVDERLVLRKGTCDFVVKPPTWLSNLWRTFLVCFTAGVAMLIPYFGNFVAVIGSVGSTFLAIILPSLFHWKLRRQFMSKRRVFLDLCLVGLGVALMLLSTGYSLKDLVEVIQKGDSSA